MAREGASGTGYVILGIIAVAVIALAFYGLPRYNVYSSRLKGEAELARAQGNRQALVAQAAAEDEASIKRAEAAGRRVAGWVKAAKEGCAALGRTSGPEKAECENMLIRNSLTFSVAHEGNPGVNLIIGANGNVSVPAGAKASAGAE